MSVKIHLAATSHVKTPIVDKLKPHYLLESFMDIKSDTEKTNKYVDWCLKSDGFLLDSGAFAFMNGNMATKNDINIEDYVKKYINFINKKDISSFFENNNKISIYIYLFDLFSKNNSSKTLKDASISLIEVLIANIQTGKDIFEYLFQKLSQASLPMGVLPSINLITREK